MSSDITKGKITRIDTNEESAIDGVLVVFMHESWLAIGALATHRRFRKRLLAV